MANQGAKKRKEENERQIKFLLYVILGATAWFVLGRMVLFWSSTSWRHWFALALASTSYKLCFDQLSYMATASYDDQGELTDGGYDLKMGGMSEYLHDIIYITAFIQFASVFSDYVWLLYLVIPAFAAYKIWQSILYPYFFGGQEADAPESEKERKKREKLEKKAGRPKFSKSKYR
eukprot:TRINITY_DN10138_c0_g1_i1.p1 TRINITY_DN10138_c0_g1~~TRINITY_DN10138_c0_g1_i1.p1  ORF type:complete len:176 (+),score=28.86 TRINITY_DN10138_c0_g1_i1:52-579(+)